MIIVLLTRTLFPKQLFACTLNRNELRLAKGKAVIIVLMSLCHPHGQSPRRPERQQTLTRITCTTGRAVDTPGCGLLPCTSEVPGARHGSKWSINAVFSESRRDQEEGGELDSHEELDDLLRVQARLRGGRWCWTLKRAQERSRAGRWSWAHKVGPPFASDVPQQLCYGHCPCDCSAQQLEQQLYTSCYANRGPRRLNIVVALAGPRPPRSFRVRAR